MQIIVQSFRHFSHDVLPLFLLSHEQFLWCFVMMLPESES